ncbi:uncharacterized protein LTR77_007543 [Saxophila tyrrhenica]|uniref:Uncharacterized protein n=1 Tax=Saxophila tyrrhenica TaxID=1690608 RepID=A0AAV9P8E5_9PEZI|nr:hypothetical protein LTR77_007543 [Saxophila tyrrhenica]
MVIGVVNASGYHSPDPPYTVIPHTLALKQVACVSLTVNLLLVVAAVVASRFYYKDSESGSRIEYRIDYSAWSLVLNTIFLLATVGLVASNNKPLFTGSIWEPLEDEVGSGNGDGWSRETRHLWKAMRSTVCAAIVVSIVCTAVCVLGDVYLIVSWRHKNRRNSDGTEENGETVDLQQRPPAAGAANGPRVVGGV